MNTTQKNYTIQDIESMTLEEAKILAVMGEIIPDIKPGYDLYLIDFGGYYGYSCCVFSGTRHIYYANDYELHHRSKSKDQLRDLYIRRARNILFSDDEIAAPLNNYAEYKRKEHFLRNYYGMQRDYQSLFSSEDRKHHTIYDHVSFAYYDLADKDFVFHHTQLYIDLTKAFNDTKLNSDFWIGAFYYEMCNHEYAINMDADWDTLGAFGNLRHDSDQRLTDMFDQLQFTQVQRDAYYTARNQYYEKHSDF